MSYMIEKVNSKGKTIRIKVSGKDPNPAQRGERPRSTVMETKKHTPRGGKQMEKRRDIASGLSDGTTGACLFFVEVVAA